MTRTDTIEAPYETVRSSTAVPDRSPVDTADGEGGRALGSPHRAGEPNPVDSRSHADVPISTGSQSTSAPSAGEPELLRVCPRNGVTAAGDCGRSAPPGAAQSYVYAIGTIVYDFGTEVRRDSFRQQMPPVETLRSVSDELPPTVSYSVPANPYGAFQMRDYLRSQSRASNKLIWTLVFICTPICALESKVPFGRQWRGPIVGRQHQQSRRWCGISGRITRGQSKFKRGVSPMPPFLPEREDGTSQFILCFFPLLGRKIR